METFELEFVFNGITLIKKFQILLSEKNWHAAVTLRRLRGLFTAAVKCRTTGVC